MLVAMLYLASKSPRRVELLGRLGVPFAVLDIDIPELRDIGEPADAYVLRVAREKALAGLAQVNSESGAYVMGADTEVILDDAVFGKPGDPAEAIGMLQRLSGRTHRVVSAVALVSHASEVHATSVSEVTFDVLGADVIAGYVATGESMGKAGAYAIQGGAEAFVTHLSGSFSGVMGLPLNVTARLLHEMRAISHGSKVERQGSVA